MVKLTIHLYPYVDIVFPFSFFVLTMTPERSIVEIVPIELPLYFAFSPLEFIFRLTPALAATVEVFEEGQLYSQGCEERSPFN